MRRALWDAIERDSADRVIETASEMARRGYQVERLGELLEDGGAEIVTIDGLGVCTSVSGVLVSLGDVGEPADVRSLDGAKEIGTARAHGLEVAEVAAEPELAAEVAPEVAPEPAVEPVPEIATEPELDTTDAVALLESINELIGAGVPPGGIAARLLKAGFSVRDEGDAGYYVTALGRVLSYNVGDGRGGSRFATLYAQAPAEDAVPEAAGNAPGAADQSEEVLAAPAGLSRERVSNYRMTDEDARWIESSSLQLKFAANMVAMRTLATLEAEQRPATREEQQALVRFTGWGAMPQLFNTYDRTWTDQRLEFEKLFERYTDEYDAAREATQNSHFTSAPIIDAIYGGLARLGFEGGRILEPCVGSGNFLGRMPESVRTHEATRVTAVEQEPTTASIARHLYPEYPNIVTSSFEKTRLLDDFYDVVVGNVPFGDYGIHDPAVSAKYAPRSRAIRVHNYFIARSLDKLRDDGLLALITSTGTLDAADAAVYRKGLAAHAELLGAVRLPEGTFKKTAGTDVTVDVLFLRKRGAEERERLRVEELERGETGAAPSGPKFIDIVPSGVETRYETPIYINEYFRDHPEMVLGEIVAGGEFGNRAVVKGTGEDVGVALTRALSNLPVGVYREVSLPQPAAGRDLASWVGADGVKNFAFAVRLVDGHKQLLVRNGESLTPVTADADRIQRVEGLIGIRDSVREVLRTQIGGARLDYQVAAREQLGAVYDAFVARFGPVSDPRNRLAYKGDPDSYLLLALENYDAKAKRATKTQIFTEAVVARPEPVERVATAREAVALSLVERGSIDVATVARLVDTSKIEAAALMVAEGAAFRDPLTARFVASEEYLSGNVREKLEIARMVAELDPTYRPNVEALLAAQPEPIPASEIGIRLGAGWIPPELISSFLKDTLAVRINVSYVEATAEWVYHSRGRANLDSVANRKEWGTAAMTGATLVEYALNSKVPTVYRDEGDIRVVDATETEAAREMQSKLRDRFKQWAWESEERLTELETIYNERFNNFRPRTFATNWYRVPGMNPLWTGDTTKGENGLRPHQLAATTRVATGANTLLAHCVGAGKSFSAIAGTQECVRLGISKKPMYVVPNQTLTQFVEEFRKLYPAARILAASDGDLSAGNRQEFLSRIATGTWDGVIVAHSSFGMIPLSQEYQQRFIESRIEALDEALRKANVNDADNRVIKRIEAAKKRYEARLDALADMKKDDTVTFEQLGIDRLVVDESHAFKALEFHTKRGHIAGLSTRASQRAFDLFMKTNYIETIAGQGRGIVFMSGTPVTNTLAELFTIQRFLQHHELVDRGLAHFDAWASVFSETVTGYESTVANKYELRTRLAEFDNLPELMALFRGVADVQTAEMLDLPRPELYGGAAIPVISPISDAQTAYVEKLSERVDDIKAKRVKPDEDNMLKVTTNGRESSLDIRLAEPWQPRDPEGKVSMLAANVARHWRESAATSATQLVFCDLGTPAKRSKKRGASAVTTPGSASFNLYEDIRNAMIEQGVARDEIAFVHDYDTDAKRARLYAAVNEGRIRVVVGSTPKLGVGVNVQRKLLAIHQLDVPFRPCDIEQRLGRILRQGNEHETVYEYRYVTQGRGGKPSFDTYLWQLNESKDRFIRQVMSGEAVPRRLEDIAERSLTYAELKAIASGNPLVYEKVRVDNDVIRLERLHNSYLTQRRAMRTEVESHIPHSISHKRRRLARLEADTATFKANRPEAGAFHIEVLGRTYSDREAAGEALRAVSQGATFRKVGETYTLGRYAGFEIALVESMAGTHLCLLGAPIDNDRQRYDASFGESAAGTIASIEAVARSIGQRIETEIGEIARLERQAEETVVLLGRPFEYEEKLATLRVRQAEINRELGLTRDDVQVVMEGGPGEDTRSTVIHVGSGGPTTEVDDPGNTADPSRDDTIESAETQPESALASESENTTEDVATGAPGTGADGEGPAIAPAVDAAPEASDDAVGTTAGPSPAEPLGSVDETSQDDALETAGEGVGAPADASVDTAEAPLSPELVVAPDSTPSTVEATVVEVAAVAPEGSMTPDEPTPATLVPPAADSDPRAAAVVAAITETIAALKQGDYVPTERVREHGLAELREAWQIPAGEYARGEGSALLDDRGPTGLAPSLEVPGRLVVIYPASTSSRDLGIVEGDPVRLMAPPHSTNWPGFHVPARELYRSPADGTLHWVPDPDGWATIIDPASGLTFGTIAAATHERIVAERLANGERVPPEILESYPHLLAEAPALVESPEAPPARSITVLGGEPDSIPPTSDAAVEDVAAAEPVDEPVPTEPREEVVDQATDESAAEHAERVAAIRETDAALLRGDYVSTERAREFGLADLREAWQIHADEYSRGEGFALLDQGALYLSNVPIAMPDVAVTIYPPPGTTGVINLDEGCPVSLAVPPPSAAVPGVRVQASEIYLSPVDGALHWLSDPDEWATIIDQGSGKTFGQIAAATHERIVADRLAKGERVPPEILESYPHLLAEAPTLGRGAEAPSAVELAAVDSTVPVAVAAESVSVEASAAEPVLTQPAAPEAVTAEPIAVDAVVSRPVTPALAAPVVEATDSVVARGVVAAPALPGPVGLAPEAVEVASPQTVQTVPTAITSPVAARTSPGPRVDRVSDDRTGSSLWVVASDVRDRQMRAAAERFGGNADLTSDPPRFRFRSEAAANAFVAALGPEKPQGPARSHAIPLTGVTAEQFVDAMPDSNLKRMLLGSASRLSEGLDVSRSAALAAAYDLVASQNPHRRIIEGAIDAGRDIPARVRADYVGAGPDELASRVAATRESWRRDELVSIPAADVAEWRLSPAEKLARLGDTREARSVAGRARALRAETGAEWNVVVAGALEETAQGRLWTATVRKAFEEGLEISIDAASALGIEQSTHPEVAETREPRAAMSLDEFRSTLAAGADGTDDSRVLLSRLVSVLDGFPAGTRLGDVAKLEANGVSLWAEPGHSFQTTEQFVSRDIECRVEMLYAHALETIARDASGRDQGPMPGSSAPAVDHDGPDEVQRRVWESAKGFFTEKRDAATSEQERHRLVALGGRVEAWVFAQRDDVLASLDCQGVEALIERALPREAGRLLGGEPAATASSCPEQPSLLM